MHTTLVARIARDLIAEGSLLKHDIKGDAVKMGSDRLWEVVNRKVKRLRPTTLALIIWHGRAHKHLHAVHRESWLNEFDDGRELLREIAATTLVTEIIGKLSLNGVGSSGE